MRVITVNVNGIRSAGRKGFFTWLATQNADIVCIQETKAQLAQLDDFIYFPAGYHCYYHDAIKKGYSGVALYTKHCPDQVNYGIGWPHMDTEGRWLEARFGALSVISLYLPSGSSGDLRQQFKFALMNELMPVLKKMRRSKREYLICGDWNIAHREIDLKNWRGNRKNSGFLPEERAWLDMLFDRVGFIDSFRHINPDENQFTWWSNRGQAWDKNVGWRIDYQIATPKLGKSATSTSIYKDERFSDHAPLLLDYDYSL